jgi:collagenase-like PrtC family protease
MLKLALGPILYYWPRATVFAFYEALATSALDIVYLGETVCSRRHELRLSDWLEIADMLAANGKEVVLSTQALIESGSELASARRITDNGRYTVEANDMGAVHCLQGRVPFVAGPHLNLFNAPSLDFVARLGAKRWVMPLEMGRDALEHMHEVRPAGLATEVFAYGRMPLAFSARCFTARNRNLPKDDCQFSCLNHPDGLLVQTREKQPFLVLNGTQTHSATVYNLVQELPRMQTMGVDVVRISPQAQNTDQIIAVFDRVRRGELSAAAAPAAMKALMPGAPCNGFWLGKPGMEQHEQAA